MSNHNNNRTPSPPPSPSPSPSIDQAGIVAGMYAVGEMFQNLLEDAASARLSKETIQAEQQTLLLRALDDVVASNQLLIEQQLQQVLAIQALTQEFSSLRGALMILFPYVKGAAMNSDNPSPISFPSDTTLTLTPTPNVSPSRKSRTPKLSTSAAKPSTSKYTKTGFKRGSPELREHLRESCAIAQNKRYALLRAKEHSAPLDHLP